MLVLSLGLLLVVPAIVGRPAVSQGAVSAYSASISWASPVHSRNALEFAQAYNSPTLGDPSPMVVPAAAPPASQPPPARQSAPVRAVPAPSQKPAFTPPPPGSGGDGLAAIYAVFGNSPGLSWALRVANCESHYNPLAVNRSSGASGLFQFMPSTWNANFPGQNIWDPMAQARGALVFYNAGRQSAWTCK